MVHSVVVPGSVGFRVVSDINCLLETKVVSLHLPSCHVMELVKCS